MTHAAHVARFAIVAALFAPRRAAADPLAPFSDPAWRVVPALSVGVERFDYKEDVPAPLRSQHDAWLPVGQLAVEARAPGDRWYARGSFSLADGAMTYDGTDQSGAPQTGPTRGDLSDAELVVGGRARWFSWPLWLGGYTGVGHHTWRRDLRPIGAGGYREVYTWSSVPLALTADAVVSPRLLLTADAGVLLPFASTVRAHLADFDPSYSNVTLTVAGSAGLRAHVAGSYALVSRVHITASVLFEALRNQQGPATVVLVDGQEVLDGNGDPLAASEPGSTTYRTTLSVGADYTF